MFCCQKLGWVHTVLYITVMKGLGEQTPTEIKPSFDIETTTKTETETEKETETETGTSAETEKGGVY